MRHLFALAKPQEYLSIEEGRQPVKIGKSDTPNIGLKIRSFAIEVAKTIGGIAHEIFATFLYAVTYFVYRSWWNPKHPDPHKPTILLIHGYFHNSSAWHYLSMKLKGQYNVYTIDLGSFEFLSVEKYSERVQEKLRDIQKATGQNKIYIGAHSMGGLVATHAATSRQEGDPEVPLIITLGSPLEGTHLARMAPGQCARDMEVGSPFLADLRKRIDQAVGIRFVHFSSTSDEIIQPQTSARPNHPNADYVLCPNMGHIGYLFSPMVANEILKVLPKEV